MIVILTHSTDGYLRSSQYFRNLSQVLKNYTDENIKVIRLNENQGKGMAVKVRQNKPKQ
jgi:hypothetical protein